MKTKEIDKELEEARSAANSAEWSVVKLEERRKQVEMIKEVL
jgi:hypothetical protein